MLSFLLLRIREEGTNIMLIHMRSSFLRLRVCWSGVTDRFFPVVQVQTTNLQASKSNGVSWRGFLRLGLDSGIAYPFPFALDLSNRRKSSLHKPLTRLELLLTLPRAVHKLWWFVCLSFVSRLSYVTLKSLARLPQEPSQGKEPDPVYSIGKLYDSRNLLITESYVTTPFGLSLWSMETGLSGLLLSSRKESLLALFLYA